MPCDWSTKRRLWTRNLPTAAYACNTNRDVRTQGSRKLTKASRYRSVLAGLGVGPTQHPLVQATCLCRRVVPVIRVTSISDTNATSPVQSEACVRRTDCGSVNGPSSADRRQLPTCPKQMKFGNYSAGIIRASCYCLWTQKKHPLMPWPLLPQPSFSLFDYMLNNWDNNNLKYTGCSRKKHRPTVFYTW